jgi:hypothetical protein
MNKMYVFGAVIVIALLLFYVMGGFASPYYEEETEITNTVDGTWGIRLKLTDSDGGTHYVTPDEKGTLRLLHDDQEFTNLEYELSVKIAADNPGEYDYVTFDYTTSGVSIVWTGYYPNNDPIFGFQGQKSADGINQQITVDAADFTKCNYLDNPIIDMSVLDTYPEDEAYHINLIFNGVIKATPHVTGGGDSTTVDLDPPQSEVNFWFDVDRGALSYTWSDGFSP